VSMMGAGLRPHGKPWDEPPYPKMQARRISIPTSRSSIEICLDDTKTGALPMFRDQHGGNLLTGHVVSGVEGA
jgi:hypothetical protein